MKLSTRLSPKDDEKCEYMAKVPYANAGGVVSRCMHDPGVIGKLWNGFHYFYNRIDDESGRVTC